ncbi:MAG: hypothetical protein NVS2B7_18030 [Herpetosiphon sp.]
MPAPPSLVPAGPVFAVVPKSSKAFAVTAALDGLRTPNLPASILRTVAHTRLYLEWNAAACL